MSRNLIFITMCQGALYTFNPSSTASGYSVISCKHLYICEFVRVGNRQRARHMKLSAKEKIILGDGAQTDSKSYPGVG